MHVVSGGRFPVVCVQTTKKGTVGVERAGDRVTGGHRTGWSHCSFGDTANEEEVFPAYGAPGVECDTMISALKLVQNGNKLGVEVKGIPESSNHRLADAFATFISVDNAGALVTMGELAQFKEVHKIVFFNFYKEVRKNAKVIEGEMHDKLKEVTRRVGSKKCQTEGCWPRQSGMEEDIAIMFLLCRICANLVCQIGGWTTYILGCVMADKLK